MYNNETLRRFTPMALTLAIGSALLGGCGSPSEATSGPCYPGIVKNSVNESVRDVLSKNGLQLNDMLNINDASSEINTILVGLHQKAQHKYDTVLPDDTFGVCVNGNDVTAATNTPNTIYVYSVIDQ